MKPFEIQFQGLGVFPKWKKPRVLYVGIADGSAHVRDLIGQLEYKWKEAGIPPQKELKTVPHITIGRWNDLYVKNIQGDILRDSVGNFVEPISQCEVSEVVVMNSSLDLDHPTYTPIHYARSHHSTTTIRKRAKYQYLSTTVPPNDDT